MGLFDRWRKEARSVAENPQIPVSAADFLEKFGIYERGSSAGVPVTIETALGVPAVWAAVNFMAGTLASFPLHVYRKTREGRKRVDDGLARILHDAVNDDLSSFDWRKAFFVQVFTGGRAFTFIERDGLGRVMNFWPLDPAGMSVSLVEGRRVYVHTDGSRKSTYRADEIIDLAFMMQDNGYKHRGPIATNADAIGLALAVTQYGNRFFANGGVPPFAITGSFQSPGAMQRASNDLGDAVRNSAKERRQALVLPTGLEIKPIGVDPEKSQLVDLQRFVIEQIARIYSLPPTFLQDLTHGTYSNSEQQDLHFVKHTISRWVIQFEQQLNLKLFGRKRSALYASMNIDALLRGDFKTRMEGYAAGIQNAILAPNEARRKENLPDMPDGDRLLIQGATVPLGTQPAAAPGGSDPAGQTTGDPIDDEI